MKRLRGILRILNSKRGNENDVVNIVSNMNDGGRSRRRLGKVKILLHQYQEQIPLRRLFGGELVTRDGYSGMQIR